MYFSLLQQTVLNVHLQKKKKGTWLINLKSKSYFSDVYVVYMCSLLGGKPTGSMAAGPMTERSVRLAVLL